MSMASPQQRRRRGGARRTPMSEINVTPLVDVMMVLLVIFMVTAPLLKAGIAIELPDSRAKPLDQQPHGVTITMDRAGKTYLDDAELEPDELAERIAALPRAPDGKAPLVTLRADTGLHYGRVVALMGDLNHAGITSISLVTNAGGSDAAGYSQAVAETFELAPSSIPVMTEFARVTELGEILRDIKDAELILEHDLELYDHTSRAFGALETQGNV